MRASSTHFIVAEIIHADEMDDGTTSFTLHMFKNKLM